jgi:hypothetical protein
VIVDVDVDVDVNGDDRRTTSAADTPPEPPHDPDGVPATPMPCVPSLAESFASLYRESRCPSLGCATGLGVSR